MPCSVSNGEPWHGCGQLVSVTCRWCVQMTARPRSQVGLPLDAHNPKSTLVNSEADSYHGRKCRWFAHSVAIVACRYGIDVFLYGEGIHCAFLPVSVMIKFLVVRFAVVPGHWRYSSDCQDTKKFGPCVNCCRFSERNLCTSRLLVPTPARLLRGRTTCFVGHSVLPLPLAYKICWRSVNGLGSPGTFNGRALATKALARCAVLMQGVRSAVRSHALGLQPVTTRTRELHSLFTYEAAGTPLFVRTRVGERVLGHVVTLGPSSERCLECKAC
jgi:hypothetical protein